MIPAAVLYAAPGLAVFAVAVVALVRFGKGRFAVVMAVPWRLGATKGITGSLIAFVVIGVIGVAMGITFGTLSLIENSLNGTLTIPSSISNALDTTANLGGTGLIVAAAVAIISIVLLLVYMFAGRSR